MAKNASLRRSPAVRRHPTARINGSAHPRAAAGASAALAHAAAAPDAPPALSLTPEQFKHLDYIQNTITRFVTHAFAVKGWSLTVSGIVFAYAAAHLDIWIALVALLPPVAFAWLDLYYLRQEELMQELYRDAISPGATVPVLAMETACYCDARAHPRCSWRQLMKRSSWWVLHGMVIAVGLMLLGVAIFR